MFLVFKDELELFFLCNVAVLKSEFIARTLVHVVVVFTHVAVGDW